MRGARAGQSDGDDMLSIRDPNAFLMPFFGDQHACRVRAGRTIVRKRDFPSSECCRVRRVETLLILVLLSSCATSGEKITSTWPVDNVLPHSYPADLDTDAPHATLRLGTDGLWYVVGNRKSEMQAGTRFLARYGGDWPLADLPRPPLASGHVMADMGNGVALVALLYQIPDSELSGLNVTWEAGAHDEQVGKGITTVHSVQPNTSSDVELRLGESAGVQPGDVYAILSPQDSTKMRELSQISRRIVDICLVNEVGPDRSTCRTWLHRGAATTSSISAGHPMVFLEHTFGLSPRRAIIEIAATDGSQDQSIQTRLEENFRRYVDRVPHGNIDILSAPFSAAATDFSFYRNESKSKRRGFAQIVVGISLVPKANTQHLVVNYTGVGPATGPGMVAAPPEQGVDLGPVEGITEASLSQFAAVVYAGILVYRGQTSEAMIHLRNLLSNPNLTGALRWHVRDQYAMQWAALGYLQEALWLVKQDQQTARLSGSRLAYLNALGTLVRLYDMLGLTGKALKASSEYLQLRSGPPLDLAALPSALGMHTEVLLAAGNLDEAASTLFQMEDLCPDGCNGDLGMILANIYWAVPSDEREFQDKVLAGIVSFSRTEDDDRRAATRIYQGLSALRDEQLEEALIAFLEAERLYRSTNTTPGVARAKYLMLLTQLARNEWKKSMELANESLQYSRDLRDFQTASKIYDRMSSLYSGLDLTTAPPPQQAAAEQIMAASIQSHLAHGNYSKSAEGLFRTGIFLLRSHQFQESQNLFRQAVLYAIRSTRFDLAALSHLSLGLIAREEQDEKTFRDEIHRAAVMGALSKDKSVMETIRRTLEPPAPNPQVPTQLL
jgi:tetratricopeptide (TPR) repeat protein